MTEAEGLLECAADPDDLLMVTGGTSLMCTIPVEITGHPAKVVVADPVALQLDTTDEVIVIQEDVLAAVEQDTTYQ